MSSKKQGYPAVAMKPKTIQEVERLAKREGRQFTRQAELLIEIGLAEYKRQKAEKVTA
jgi:predicted transcriptional regulator